MASRSPSPLLRAAPASFAGWNPAPPRRSPMAAPTARPSAPLRRPLPPCRCRHPRCPPCALDLASRCTGSWTRSDQTMMAAGRWPRAGDAHTPAALHATAPPAPLLRRPSQPPPGEPVSARAALAPDTPALSAERMCGAGAAASSGTSLGSAPTPGTPLRQAPLPPSDCACPLRARRARPCQAWRDLSCPHLPGILPLAPHHHPL